MLALSVGYHAGMRRILLSVVLTAGCAGGAREASLRREVDPALLHGDVRAAVAASQKLGGLDDRRLRVAAETVVWTALQSPDAEQRVRAARVALSVEAPALDREMPRRLIDSDPRVRALAAVLLAPQAPEARQVLAAALKSSDPAARLIALDGIGYLDDLPALLTRLANDADPQVRARVASELGARNPRELVETLLRKLLSDGDAGVRAAAIRAVGVRGDRALSAEVERALEDPSLGTRLAALSAITRFGTSASRLAALGSGADHYLALRAAVQLHRLGKLEQALAAVPTAAADRRPEVRAAAMNAAGELGPAGAALALPLLRDPDREVRFAAARALIAAGQPAAALPFLIAAVSTQPALPFALDAADELARLGNPLGRATLERALGSADAFERRRAVSLLAPLPGSLLLLEHALADIDPDVRLSAAESLLRRAYRPYLKRNWAT